MRGRPDELCRFYSERDRKPLERLFDALFVASQLLMGETAAGAVFSCCTSRSVGCGLNLSKRLRLPLSAMKGLVGQQHEEEAETCVLKAPFLDFPAQGGTELEKLTDCVCMQMCLCACMGLYICMCMCVHVYICVYICIFMFMFCM